MNRGTANPEQAAREALAQQLDQLDMDIQAGRMTTLPADLEKRMRKAARQKIDLNDVIEGNVSM